MDNFVKLIEAEFKKHADPLNALGQKAYMRNQFEYFGIKSPIRKEIQRPFLRKEALPSKQELPDIVKELWNIQQRELQYFAMELVSKYNRQFEEDDIALFEWMLTHKSWWDTVDFIAAHIIGGYFEIFPEKRDKIIERWINSGNIWLMRSSLLFQLKYNDKLDTDFLTFVIYSVSGSKEFFINKAIGWILRQYSKTNPQWVIDFVNNNELNNLSRREAFKVINKVV